MQYRAISEAENPLSQPGADVAQLRVHSLELQPSAHLRTTLLPPGMCPPLRNVLTVLLDRESVVRQTQLAMALQIWKRHYGQWPESLLNLLLLSAARGVDMHLSDVCIIDPWSGEQFQYRGSQPVPTDVFTKTQTIVNGVGPNNIRVVPSGIYSVALRTWNNTNAVSDHDDRCRLDVVDDGIVLVPPDSKRGSH